MCTSYGYNCQYPPDESPTAQFVDPPHPVSISHASHGIQPHGVSSSASDGHSPRLLLKSEKSVGGGAVASEEETANEKERSTSPDAVDRGLLDPFKERYMGIHSAVAFPRALGIDLQSSNPPRVHSFAWNCGVRPEEPAGNHRFISEMVSKEEYEFYWDVYLRVVHPVFGILSPELFRSQADGYFTSSETEVVVMKPKAFNAVLAGVLALGSFFAGEKRCSNEHLLVAHAKDILEDPVFVRVPGLHQVLGNVLRTIYLRATTRPHVSWLSSCTAFHCAEATGLHREIDHGVTLTSDQVSPEDSTNINKIPAKDTNNKPQTYVCGRSRSGNDVIRRLFWISWAMNRIISYEYGRSWVQLNGITTKLPHQEEGDYTYWFIQLIHIIPTIQGHRHDPLHARTSTAELLLKALGRLSEIPDAHPFITLSKTDIATSIYRRLRLLSISPPSLTTHLIHLGTASLKASMQLIEQRHFWWQNVCTIFQYICVLLALDDTRSLREVKPAMQTLEQIYGVLGTHVSREAVNTANLLIRDARRKKRRDLLSLEGVGEDDEEEGQYGGVEGGGVLNGGLGDGGFGALGRGAVVGENAMQGQWNWQLDGFDWDSLLDPGFGFIPQDLGAF